MASTDLAVAAQQLPAHLRGAAPTSDEFTGGLGASFPLAFLSTRGKEFRLRKDGQELNTRQREIKAVFVAARASLSKRYYEKQYSSGSTEAPDCSSKDSVTPDVAKPVAPACGTCPKNQWGSRITENGKEGKACSDYKRVVLWLIGLTDEPVVLDVAATSLKAPKGQQHTELMLGDFLSQLAKHGMDPTHVVATVGFTDAEYPQLHFGFDRFVTEDEFANVLKLRESEDVQTVIKEGIFEPSGEVKQAEAPEEPVKMPDSEPKAEPAPEPKAEPALEPKAESAPEPKADSIPAFPGKTTVMKNDAGELTIAEDESQYALAWAQGFRPAQTATVGGGESAPEPEPKAEAEPKAEPAPEPKAEPAPEPKAKPTQNAGGGDDLLSQVAALLGGQGN